MAFCSDTSTYTLFLLGKWFFQLCSNFSMYTPVFILMIFLLKDPTSPSPAVYLSKKEKEMKENDITFALIERWWRKKKNKCQHKIPIFLWTTLSLIMELFTNLACYWKWHDTCFNRLFAASTPVMVYMLMFVFHFCSPHPSFWKDVYSEKLW